MPGGHRCLTARSGRGGGGKTAYGERSSNCPRDSGIEGDVWMEDGAAIHVEAPVLDVADTCGAGATFSAAFISSRLNESEFDWCLRFAVAAASLKCSVIGPRAFSPADVNRLADTLPATILSL
ncbi:MAG: PfkB family carbohydrate kinase [Chloroflexota bacterium]|nr:PfkB family carbohydrate kinase [Chloroflexota bacterium]